MMNTEENCKIWHSSGSKVKNQTDIFVFADWIGLPGPTPIGVLTAQQAKGRKAFSFRYDSNWIQSAPQRLLDPDIQWYSGPQHPAGKDNFGIFMDSMPDSWGRKLMLRRAAQEDALEKNAVRTLHDIDFLLGVYDETRMGALRFKTDPDGPFLDSNAGNPTPPWSTIRELQHAASVLESGKPAKGLRKYLEVLVAPGSSLGGARPKANLTDEDGNLWIAKFPSQNDIIDKAAWEFLAYKLAVKAGVTMSDSSVKQIEKRHHTFFTRRFDREKKSRIHFSSAMTMLGKSEEMTRDNPASYLDIALFIQTYGCHITADLHQLWRRIIFNIAISNTDDHLRNHGFLLTDAGWRLSPAFDVNPSIDKAGLQLNIDATDNRLDFELAKSVGIYFQLNNTEMNQIIQEVTSAVVSWKRIAKTLSIAAGEMDLMAPAFSSVSGKVTG